MNQKIEKDCSQREPEVTYYHVSFTTDEIRALDDNALADFAHEAAVNITCRTGKTSKQREKWNGRTLKSGNPVTLSEIVAYLATTGERVGGKPSAADVEKRDTQWMLKREAFKKEFPDDTPTQEANRLAEWVNALLDKNATKYGDDWSCNIPEDATAKDIFLQIVRANRRANERIAARNARKQSDDDLS